MCRLKLIPKNINKPNPDNYPAMEMSIIPTADGELHRVEHSSQIPRDSEPQ